MTTTTNFQALLATYRDPTTLPSLPTILANPRQSLEKRLQTLGEVRSLARSPPPPPHPTTTTLYLTVCITIVDQLPHETLWRLWESTYGSSCLRSRIVIHAKHLDKDYSPWVRERLLPFTYRPAYSSIEVVQAMLAEWVQGVSEWNCEWCMFVTERCVPLVSLSELATQLVRGQSRFPIQEYAQNTWEREHCFGRVDRATIPSSFIRKSVPGWILVARTHILDVLLLLRLTGPCEEGLPTRRHPLLVAFEHVFAPEEMFFPTLLTIVGARATPPPMYAVWKEGVHPVLYPTLTLEQGRTLRARGYWFARKFEHVDVDVWNVIIK